MKSTVIDVARHGTHGAVNCIFQYEARLVCHTVGDELDRELLAQSSIIARRVASFVVDTTGGGFLRQLLLVKVLEAGIGGVVAVDGEVCIVRSTFKELRTTSKQQQAQEEGEKSVSTNIVGGSAGLEVNSTMKQRRLPWPVLMVQDAQPHHRFTSR